MCCPEPQPPPPQNFDAAAARYRSESEFVMSTARYLELPPELQDRIRCAAALLGLPLARSSFPLRRERCLSASCAITTSLCLACFSSFCREYYEFMQHCSHPGRDGMHELTKLPKKLFEDIVCHMHGAP